MLDFKAMRTISKRAWLLVILSAGLQIFMFPTGGPMPAWRTALAWVALVPFLAALLARGTNGEIVSVKASTGLGYLCGFLWFLGNCFWIYQTMYLYGGLAKPISFGILILFSLYLGLYHALFAGLFVWVRRSRLGRSGTLILTPFLWVAVELARSRITGFPWDLLGVTQVDNVVVTAIAPVAGVLGISFLVVAVNAGLAFALGKGGSWQRRFVTPIVFALLAIGLQLAGLARKPIAQSYHDQLAVMMQENLSVGATGREVRPLSVQEELNEFTAASQNPDILLYPEPLWSPSLKRDFLRHGGRDFGRLNVVIWPEAPAHFQSDDPQFQAKVAELAALLKVPAIVGNLGVDADRTSPRGYYLYDSASMFDAAGNYSGRYDKIHLVPWGEYIPFKRFFGFAQKLTEGVGDMDPGHERTVFRTGGHTYGVFICYESIFGDEVREFVKNGAEVLVNISDDGWYGDTGAPWQHLNMARMRAIENHRWVLRSTNTGVTTAIDPQGFIAREAPRHVRGAFAFAFAFEQGTTFYTRHGDWFAYLCALVTILACALGYVRRPAV